MSWDLSSEEVICSQLESQQRIIEAFSKKIIKLQKENEQLKASVKKQRGNYVGECVRAKEATEKLHGEIDELVEALECASSHEYELRCADCISLNKYLNKALEKHKKHKEGGE